MKSYILYLIFSLLPIVIYAQPRHTISGYITDKSTGEVLIGATISENSIMKGTVTNDYGFFSLSLLQGKHSITCSYIGYNSFSFDIDLQTNQVKKIQLIGESLDIEEVVITANHSKNQLQTNEFKVENLTIKDIRQLPSIFGEADVIKAVQLQSGVKTLGDGSSGMFIRGGSSDQNLIMIDEAPIYNPSHMFGLISVFNADAINNVTLYKSNMPAQYGGRVSAVIDCKMKEGNLYNYNYSASINPFSFSVFANGPLVKEKSAFLVSARRSVADLFFSPRSGGTFSMLPSFYDVNVKMNSKLGNKNRLFLSLYNGKDQLHAVDGFNNEWSNLCGAFRWNRNLSTIWFSNISLIYSNYINNMKFDETGRNYEWQTGVKDLNVKADITGYLSPGNSIKFGVNSIYHQFIPGESADSLESISRMQALESSAYVLNDITLYNWLGLNYGVRLSLFHNIGDATWSDYDEQHQPVNSHSNKSGVYNRAMHLEPRISANITLNPRYSIKLAYARNAQYMQILQNSSLSYTSIETWFPANPNSKPILADVFSLGWFHQTGQQYFFSAEVYYKNIKNRIDYIDHANLFSNPHIVAETRSGKERAYGIELELKKEKGKFSGSVVYSYSRALRKIQDINEGKEYSSPQDIPHDIRVTGSYKLSEKWSFSSFWMFASGRPATLPIGFYYDDFSTVYPIFPDRNSCRFPNYHRLDVAANYTTKPKNKRIYWDISFGIYNLYGRKNTLGYQFVTHGSEITVNRYRLFSVMPSISIKANF